MLAARTVRYSWPPIRRTMSARESATVDRDHLKSETRFMDGGKAMQHDILNTEVTTIDGQKTTLADYAGRVLLIVNVASKCGLTPQYEQLETLQRSRARWAYRAWLPLQPVPGPGAWERRGD